MTTKIALYAVIILTFIAMALPVTGQIPGRNTPLTDDDAQIMQLVGDSYGNTMGGIGEAYRYLLTKDPEHEAGFSSRMNQADKNLLELKNYLLLERPNNRDLHQAMETVISAKALAQTGAQSLLASLNTPKTNNLPQEIVIFSARVDHFNYTFDALERALFNCLILTYGTDNRDLKAAEAVARLQWDSVESMALAHKFLLTGDRMTTVQFDNKLTDFDSQVAIFRSNRDLTPPDQKTVAAALDILVQKKARFADKIQVLFKAKEMNQGIDPSMLTLLKTDINAFISAVRGFVDLSCKKAATTDP
ncbi:MAG: hypothetical protein KJ964_11305 [Verrucomicrobia bacterium]|nr:hypothetical protein [Verrucomicrobiota bacterium]MBU1734218.1 hypothetical protein [Verrucomicrobiota bacterium]MBU1855756.1 hypothetical protein [Verrucomicrobiota bacterium]